ncbi:MAG TPA: hypothetical protein VNE62_02000, partial [Actinomycetota bacterium]|nr:hypothetical protein [Actinomycetota bacterium]
TVAMAKFGIELDYRVVSVVKFDESPPAMLNPVNASPVVCVASVTWVAEGARTSCTVRLESDGRESTGEAAGSAATVGRARLAARAALQAMGDLLEQERAVELVDLQVAALAGRRAVVVLVVDTSDPAEQVLLGCALVGHEESDAAIEAVIDSLCGRRPA